jgi:hypothetical protein
VALGNTYIFNLYSVPANVNLNYQGRAGTIPAPSKNAPAPYTPSQIVVPRTSLNQEQLSGQIVMCQGQNDIAIDGGQRKQVTVVVPPPPAPPLEDDLWLYLAYEEAYLFNSRGVLIPGANGIKSFAIRKV